jgi:hypothetical protein
MKNSAIQQKKKAMEMHLPKEEMRYEKFKHWTRKLAMKMHHPREKITYGKFSHGNMKWSVSNFAIE